jgi:hypothetical protein
MEIQTKVLYLIGFILLLSLLIGMAVLCVLVKIIIYLVSNFGIFLLILFLLYCIIRDNGKGDSNGDIQDE